MLTTSHRLEAAMARNTRFPLETRLWVTKANSYLTTVKGQASYSRHSLVFSHSEQSVLTAETLECLSHCLTQHPQGAPVTGVPSKAK